MQRMKEVFFIIVFLELHLVLTLKNILCKNRFIWDKFRNVIFNFREIIRWKSDLDRPSLITFFARIVLSQRQVSKNVIFNFTWEIIRWKSKNWLRLSKFGTFNRYYWIWYSMRVFSKLFFWYGGPHADEKEWSNEKYFSGQSIETFQRGYVAVPRQSSLLTIAASKSRWRRFCGPGNAHGKMVMRSQQKLFAPTPLLLSRLRFEWCRIHTDFEV